MEDVYLLYRLLKQQFNSNHGPQNSLNGNAGVESEPAQPKSKSKVKLNFGLSLDFSVQRKAKSKVKVTHCCRVGY